MKFFIFSIVLLFSSPGFSANLSIEKVENVSLDTPMTFYWEKERPLVKDVALVIARVGEDLARFRQGYEAVFFIDDRVAEKVKDLGDGRVVLIAPQGVSLSSVLWQGPVELPENIDAKIRRISFTKFLKANPYKARIVAHAKKNKTFGITPL